MIRQACFSGTWYPNDENVCRQQINDWFKCANLNGNKMVKGVIVPHAGWSHSGHVAADAFVKLIGKQYSRVFILGPCHRYSTEFCMLSRASGFETPYGIVDVDTECIQSLQKSGLFSSCKIEDEENEHSLEIELPFLIEALEADFKIIPIMVGHVSSKKKCQYAESLVTLSIISRVLAPYMEDPTSLFVISSDFCHWGSAFRYQYYDSSQGEIWESIEHLDKIGAKFIEAEDADSFADYIAEYHNTICGRNCIEIYLRILNIYSKNTSTSLLKYAQSNRIMTMEDRGVSYCAICTILN